MAAGLVSVSNSVGASVVAGAVCLPFRKSRIKFAMKLDAKLSGASSSCS